MATTITYKGSDLTSFSNNTKTLKTAGKYLEGDITISASTVLGTTTVIPSETTQTISPASGQEGLSSVTVNGITNTYVGSGIDRLTSADITITYNGTQNNIIASAKQGYFSALTPSRAVTPAGVLPTQAAATIVPSETAQTAVDQYKWTTGTITVAAITSTYVGTGVTTQSSLTVNANTITANAGYYADVVTYTMPYATARPITLAQATPNINVDSTGLVTATNNKRNTTNITGIKTAGYAKSNSPSFEVTQEASSATYQLPTLPAQSFTPSSTTQTVASTGKYMLGDITVQPIPSEYIVPSGTLTITSVDTTTTFDATSYASVAVNLKNADVTAY